MVNTGSKGEKIEIIINAPDTCLDHFEIYQYYGQSLTLSLPTKRSKRKGKINLQYKNLKPGYYALKMRNNHLKDIIIFNEAHLIFDYRGNLGQDQIITIQSSENLIMDEMKLLYKSKKKEINDNKELFYQIVFKKINQYPNTYFCQTFRPIAYTHYLLDLKPIEFQKDHFFDSIPWQLSGLENSTLLPYLITKFLLEIPNTIEGVELQIEKMLNISSNKQINELIYSHTSNLLFNNGHPEVIEHFFDITHSKIYLLKNIGDEYTFNKLKKLSLFSIGNKWPLPTFFREPNDLLEVNKNTLIVVFSQECEHCIEYLNELHQQFTISKTTERFKVILFPIDISYPIENSGLKIHKEWRVIHTGEGWNTPVIRDIPTNQVPYSILIDKDTTILGRNVSPELVFR